MYNPNKRTEQEKDITLDDVEVAIQILEHFTAKMNRAKMAIMKLQLMARGTSGNSGFNPAHMSMEDFIKIAQSVKDGKKVVQEEEENIGVMSDDDIKTAKELVNKFRNKDKQPDNPAEVKTP